MAERRSSLLQTFVPMWSPPTQAAMAGVTQGTAAVEAERQRAFQAPMQAAQIATMRTPDALGPDETTRAVYRAMGIELPPSPDVAPARQADAGAISGLVGRGVTPEYVLSFFKGERPRTPTLKPAKDDDPLLEEKRQKLRNESAAAAARAALARFKINNPKADTSGDDRWYDLYTKHLAALETEQRSTRQQVEDAKRQVDAAVARELPTPRIFPTVKAKQEHEQAVAQLRDQKYKNLAKALGLKFDPGQDAIEAEVEKNWFLPNKVVREAVPFKPSSAASAIEQYMSQAETPEATTDKAIELTKRALGGYVPVWAQRPGAGGGGGNAAPRGVEFQIPVPSGMSPQQQTEYMQRAMADFVQVAKSWGSIDAAKRKTVRAELARQYLEPDYDKLPPDAQRALRDRAAGLLEAAELMPTK